MSGGDWDYGKFGRYMRDSCENIASKLKEIEDEQEIENKVYLERERESS